MSMELVDIQPLELRFVVEAKKQSSCSIQLVNISDQCVAFKVKTTSPKKYCVRPNVGIINPNGTGEFTVTMQVQRAAPLELQCKDKFLVQCTVVESGTVEEDLGSDMFAKDSGRYVEERKLRVILAYSPQPLVLTPVNGIANHDTLYDTSERDKVPSGVENLPPPQKEAGPEGLEIAKPIEDLKCTENAGTAEIAEQPARTRSIDSKEVKIVEEKKFSRNEKEDLLKKEWEDYKSKSDALEAKLAEAEQTAAKLSEERSKAVQEKEIVKRELALMKRRVGGKTIHLGFPLLYVCMVALICLTLGYLMQ